MVNDDDDDDDRTSKFLPFGSIEDGRWVCRDQDDPHRNANVVLYFS